MKMMRRARGAALAFAFGLSTATVASAEEPVHEERVHEAETPQVPQAPDVVKLRAGGRFRGTITELVPNDYVVIVLMSGEQRRVPMAEVEYAGPTQAEPPQAAPAGAPPPLPPPLSPPSTVPGPQAPFSFRSDPPGMTLYVKTRSPTVVGSSPSGYGRVCTSPCEASLPAGTYRMAVSEGAAPPREVEGPVHLSGPARVHARVESHAGRRVAGWMLILGGTVTGVFLIATAREEREGCGPSSCYAEVDNDEGKSLAGMLLLAAGVGFGIPLALTKNKPRLEISPMAAPVGYRLRDRDGDVIARDTLSVRLLAALALRGRF